MCGRFTNAAALKEFDDRYSLRPPPEWHERYNIAPSQPLLAIRRTRDEAEELVMMRFGLIPRWAPQPSVAYKMINARAETLTERIAYRGLIESHRCLILADGFYEWAADSSGRRRPIRFTVDGGRLFAFAGLWSSWLDPQTDEWIDSAAIVTTAPNPLVARAHDRMPVILGDQAEDDWLDTGTSVRHALELLVPFPAERMDARPVSEAVNSVRNDHPTLLVA